MLQSGQAPTLKQMMFASVAFKTSFWGAIICVALTVILGIILPFAQCRGHNYSCSYYYYNYDNECYSYGASYCCTYSYRTCGDYYCMPKPT